MDNGPQPQNAPKDNNTMTNTAQNADLPPLGEVIRTHGLVAKKSLGQNFLRDLNLTRRIARAGGPLDSGTVIEIGPGPGGLTRALLMEGAQSLVVVEKDNRCLAALEDIKAVWPEQLHIMSGDAMDCDWGDHPPPRRLVANLPYNMATPLLIGWLNNIAHDPQIFASLTLMFQKEVAARLVAPPQTRAYGRLSVLTQWLCRTDLLFDISPNAFVPAPKVTSSVIRLTPHEKPLAPAQLATLEKITEAAFGKRRKMLRQSLKSLSPHSTILIQRAELDETARAEDLSVADFCRLADCFDHLEQHSL